jgi:uncharacterized protein (TIGR02217 family)
MTITINNNLILPESVIQAGIRGKNMRNNTRVMSGSGFESVNINWARTLRQYELGIKPMEVAQWLEIEALHEATDGGASGFKMRDPKDKNVTHTNGRLQGIENGVAVGTVGVAFGTRLYTLNKRYSTISGVSTYDRRITRPGNPIEVKLQGTTLTDGVDYIYSEFTGIVTLEALANQNPSSYTVGTATQITFPNTTFTSLFTTGQRVFITGVQGTAASILNNRSHSVSNISSNVMTISVTTTGLTVTGVGSAARYPQANNTLTWSGDFFVPVHFANDEIDWEVLVGGTFDNRIIAGPSVVLQEVRE